MKILQISEDLPPVILGGSGRIAWETSLALVRQGHEVHLLTSAPKGSFPAMQNGIHIHTTPRRSMRFAHYRSVFSKTVAKETLNVIDALQPDLIHAHGLAWQTGYKWIQGAVERGIPVFCHGVMHIAYGKVLGTEKRLWLRDLKRARWEINPLRNILIRKALNQTKKIICVSNALKGYLAQYGYTHTVTLHNGIDLHFWKEQMRMKDARTALGLPADKTIFLLAGRIGHDKGSTLMNHVLPENAHLVIAGSADLSELSHIKNRITFLKDLSQEDMRTLYSAVDVTLVPSIYLDPFPTMCLESMACGKPVIATTHGGSKEAVLDTKTGWVIDPLDEQAFRKRMQWCMDHREELPAIGKQARAHMEKHFSLDTYCEELLKIYKNR
jgi:glycosyltransferase involved in cell wall biosynthesis